MSACVVTDFVKIKPVVNEKYGFKSIRNPLTLLGRFGEINKVMDSLVCNAISLIMLNLSIQPHTTGRSREIERRRVRLVLREGTTHIVYKLAFCRRKQLSIIIHL